MSLFDNIFQTGGAMRRAALCVAFAAATVLSGCQVRPLYGTGTGDFGTVQSPVAAELAAIDLDSISNQYANDDAARVLYNELTYRFERGAGAPPKKYRLKVLVDVGSSEVGVERFADVPSAYTTTMNSTFVLSDLATDETLMTGRAFKSASYDFSSQRFANKRAYRDAQERVAKAVADDIAARIAGFFASQS
ncbi:LPS assembly lipoprotein LptE [Roseibium sp. Sym1]|uniref:LPS assembly lipoprotein LptE n=1 Tax=Roseibium sp. Sym1 TaxID=3016006 RepID=UPI0022B3E75F|nr:LPS assembly lipoprotein LptE [Roseibium sp. Sym1]